MKRTTEGKVGEALRSIDDPKLLVYKPPDDARNWKPCDFMVWWRDQDFNTQAAWIEVKDIDAVLTFPLSELRPSQRQGIRAAADVGMPYYLVVWWRKRNVWTISDAAKVLEFERAHPDPKAPLTGILCTQLAGAFGVDAPQVRLAQLLKSVIVHGELS